MANKGYNYDFKMFMEGIEVPFKSANIICSPNGVEASINCHSNEQLLELKPKTAIQLFYKDWTGPGARGWHIFFDGFLSRFDKNEDAAGGIGIAIQARDFRMDIRKAPAALSYNDSGDISGATYYHTAGVFRNTTYQTNVKAVRHPTPTFDNSGLGDLADVVVRIARIAAGNLALEKSDNKQTSADDYWASLKKSFTIGTNASDRSEKAVSENIQGHANGGFFLDAFVRGIWLDAAGGTKLGVFLNKRIRSDKRFIVPVNMAGFNFFKVNNLGKLGGEAAMADSQFSSIEAVIMRIAALFMTRVYSCNTPNIISLEKSSEAWKYIVDKDVRKFCVEDSSEEFGAPYLLNSSMLLPPLEFTAPPDCNLIFPCMYNRVIWQYDMDAEITRGYFTETDCFGTEGSQISKKWGFQVPNGIFYTPATDKDGKPVKNASTEYKTSRLTLEERYKGVNVMQGTVEDQVAYREMGVLWENIALTNTAKKTFDAKKVEYKKKYDETKGLDKTLDALKKNLDKLGVDVAAEQKKNYDSYLLEQQKKKIIEKGKSDSNLHLVLKHHALLKFINTRYSGRVINVEMVFNPYLISGFPGLVIADTHGDGFQTLKSMIGMIQQVKHFISRDGESVSSIQMNCVRFIDEPTDMDESGNPLYCKATEKSKAEIDPETLKYVTSPYYVGMGGDSPFVMPRVNSNFIQSDSLDMSINDSSLKIKYKYAKDFLTVSKEDYDNGKANCTYLDMIYEPNRISQFYKYVFGQKSHFMIGNNASKKFMYDSIHEAIEDNIITKNRKLLTDYEAAIEYIKRDVCCEEAFFCGILGLSINQKDKDGKTVYVSKTGLTSGDQFDPAANHYEYFGISTDKYNQMNKNKADNYKYKDVFSTTIKEPGVCSSIVESAPLTAFIEERKDAVRAYLKTVLQQVEAVSISS